MMKMVVVIEIQELEILEEQPHLYEDTKFGAGVNCLWLSEWKAVCHILGAAGFQITERQVSARTVRRQHGPYAGYPSDSTT
jgi:hypothetical protein